MRRCSLWERRDCCRALIAQRGSQRSHSCGCAGARYWGRTTTFAALRTRRHAVIPSTEFVSCVARRESLTLAAQRACARRAPAVCSHQHRDHITVGRGEGARVISNLDLERRLTVVDQELANLLKFGGPHPEGVGCWIRDAGPCW